MLFRPKRYFFTLPLLLISLTFRGNGQLPAKINKHWLDSVVSVEQVNRVHSLQRVERGALPTQPAETKNRVGISTGSKSSTRPAMSLLQRVGACDDTSARLLLQSDSLMLHGYEPVPTCDGNVLLSGAFVTTTSRVRRIGGFLLKCDQNGKVFWTRLYDSARYLDSMRREITADSTGERFFSGQAYDRFFDKYFTLLNYERSNFTEGNAAALDITENATRLNLTLSHKAGASVFSVGTKLNVKDSTGFIFSGSKPTAGTEIFISHSFLLRNYRLLKFDEELREQNYRERRFVLDCVALVYQRKNPDLIRLLLQKSDTLERKRDRHGAVVLSQLLSPEGKGKVGP